MPLAPGTPACPSGRAPAGRIGGIRHGRRILFRARAPHGAPSWNPGVERERAISAASISAGIASNSGVVM